MQPETKQILDTLNREMPNWREVDALPLSAHKPIFEMMGFAEFVGKPLMRFARYDKC